MHKRKMRICQDHKISTLLHIALYKIAQNSHTNTFVTMSPPPPPTTAVQQRQSVNPVGCRSPSRTSWTAFDC